MTPEEFADAVRSENRTALSRLGSSKSLYADTGGEMDETSVLTAAADAAVAAAETFEAWVDENEGAASEAFVDAAKSERNRYETILDELDEHDPGEIPAIQVYLRDLDGAAARAGGLLGHLLVLERKTDQLTGFFVGQASPLTAQTFRELAGEVDDRIEACTALLETLPETDDDRERAVEAAGGAVGAAYDEYFETLKELGVNPKPVC